MATRKYYIVDTNVLLVASLPEHAEHRAREASISWLPATGVRVVANAVHHFPRVPIVVAMEQGGGFHTAP